MAELRLVFPEAETFFDLIVAENGAVLYWIHGSRLL
jgi:hypothetical protein